jgi:hypothetical protein
VIDPRANKGCRIWSAVCPKCEVKPAGGCYMLGYEVNMVWCQCPACETRFWWDTKFGRGGAPPRKSVFDWLFSLGR